MILPIQFDTNEWFILTSLLITTVLIFALPKVFPLSISILILLYGSAFARATDRFIGAKPLNFYDMNDTAKFDFFDLFTWFMYPAFGYFFLYIYEKFQFRKGTTVLYVFFFAFFSVGFEWITHKVGIFHYKDWKIFYSFPVYLLILPVYLLFYNFLCNRFKNGNI